VTDLLKSFGWMHILDLGDIATIYFMGAHIRHTNQRNVQYKDAK